MFTEATYRNIADEPVWVGFNFDPIRINSEFDHIVIPAANWLNKSDALEGLVKRLQKVDLPVTCIGLGAQADSIGVDPEKIGLSDASIELARTISDRSKYISVRGEFTRKVLDYLGIKNTVVTGCPSLYMDLPKDKVEEKLTDLSGELVLQGTRYNMQHSYLQSMSIDKKIFTIAGQAGLDIVFQSERPEISFLDGSASDEWDRDAENSGLDKLYGRSGAGQLKEYLRKHGRVFTSIDVWSDFVRSRAGVIGTRLHGAILALNSGVPAVLLPHDSRTQEILDFALIPTGSPEILLDEARNTARLPDDIFDQVGAFSERREKNRAVYEQFLNVNGLKYVKSKVVEKAA